jgi:hypothetical protein
MIPPGLEKRMVPPGVALPPLWSRPSTVPSKRTGSIASIRLRTTKSLLLGPFWKVATLPAGRNGIGLPGTLGSQLMIAESVSTVIVSIPGVARL